MAREPTYPNDATIGAKSKASAPPSAPDAPQPPSAPAAPTPPEPAPETAEAEARGSDPRRRKHLMAGAAIGIGSAAIVAALLYANRSRRDRQPD